MNRVLQPRPLVVLGLDVWMGTAAGADKLGGTEDGPGGGGHCDGGLFRLKWKAERVVHLVECV